MILVDDFFKFSWLDSRVQQAAYKSRLPSDSSRGYVTYNAAVPALKRRGGGGDGGVVGGVLADAVALHSSRGLQRGARRGAAAGQAGRRRNPLQERGGTKKPGGEHEVSRLLRKTQWERWASNAAPRRTSNQLLATICPPIIRACIMHSRSQGSPEAIPAVPEWGWGLNLPAISKPTEPGRRWENVQTARKETLDGNQTRNLFLKRVILLVPGYSRTGGQRWRRLCSAEIC